MSRQIITIGREFGSGGRIIAKEVASRMGIPFYDKRIIAMAANTTGLSEEFIEQTSEKRSRSILYSLYDTTQMLPMEDQVYIAQSQAIQQVAGEGACVIVGRCANHVLRNWTNCLHIFVHAPLESRIKRAVEYGIAPDEAQAEVLRLDKQRSAYYNHFTDQKWGEARAYDLAVNSDLGLDAVIEAIVALAK